MPWALAALPWLVVLAASWLVSGLAVARVALRLEDRLEAALLALPLGLVVHVLAGNALGMLVFLPVALWIVTLLGLVGGFAALRLAARAPLVPWPIGPAARALLLVFFVGLGAGVLAIGSREVFGDDGGHASMAHLLASGLFPLRFPCNPEMRASYGYGGNLLAAEAIVVAFAPPFSAVDVATTVATVSAALLAFLAGWRIRQGIGAGLLGVGLLFLVGPMMWLLLPLARGGMARLADAVAGQGALVKSLQEMAQSRWHYTIMTPGFVTPNYAHAHRALSWALAPVQILLFLALAEARVSPARKTAALAVVFGATGLLQPAALPLLLPAVVAAVLLARRLPSLGFNPAVVLAAGLALIAIQGGPVTDSLLDRWAGVTNPTTTFRFDPLQLPSCRREAPSLACLVLSVANVGLAPLLLPWVGWRAARAGWGARLVLALGCAAAYGASAFLRYDYEDWNMQRLITFSSWTLAVLAAPLLAAALARGGAARGLAALALVILTYGGVLEAFVVVSGRDVRDSVDTGFFQIGPQDEALEPLGPSLPLGARVFDPAGCLFGTASRPAILFGRYTVFSRDRLYYAKALPSFKRLLAGPRADQLRAAGYTHFYLDDRFLDSLAPDARRSLAGDAFELVGDSGEGKPFRALLRVCEPNEGCSLSLPGLLP
jgi:hypothetical protein